jgi:protein O-GlcNAc transferase
MQNNKKIVLHVGCGSANISALPAYFQSDEWEEIRLDIDESVNPDIVGTMLDMGLIGDETVDAVYSSHNIEHVYPHEVFKALNEFNRVLKKDGVAVISCPDIQSVAQTVAVGNLMAPLYISPAGPISAIDIIYGHRASMMAGNLFMAHRTAFTSLSLATQLKESTFETVVVARDKNYGLHALAYRKTLDGSAIEDHINKCIPDRNELLDISQY